MKLNFDFKGYLKHNHILNAIHQSMSYEDFVEGIKPNIDDAELNNTDETSPNTLLGAAQGWTSLLLT